MLLWGSSPPRLLPAVVDFFPQAIRSRPLPGVNASTRLQWTELLVSTSSVIGHFSLPPNPSD